MAAPIIHSRFLRLALFLLLAAATLRPAESGAYLTVESAKRAGKRVSLTRHAHAAQLLRRQHQQRRRSDGAVSASLGFPLTTSTGFDGVAIAAANAAAAAAAGSSGGPIKYGGGPVIVGNPTVNVYHVYYGAWGAQSGASVLENFVKSLSSDSGAQGSGGEASVKGWWAINAAYYQMSGSGGKKNVSSKVRLAGTTKDNYSRGKQLTDSDVLTIVKSKIGSGKPFTTLDPHGIYVVLTSADVTLPGYCSQYCGWHNEASLGSSSSPLRYAFVGHHAQCPDGCGASDTSPSGSPAVDATVSTLAHEIAEAATDPDVSSGWMDDSGEENADLCSWSYGNAKTGYDGSGNSYSYNVVGLGGMRFLVQLNWDRVLQKCVLQNALPGDSGGGGGGFPPPPPTGGVKMNCQCTCTSASNPVNW